MMEKEQSNDLLQENTKNEPFQREASDNFNLTGLSKNQAIPFNGLEKYQSINLNNSLFYQPEKSNHFHLGSVASVLSNLDDNNFLNLFKSSIDNNNFGNHLQIPSSVQDLSFVTANNNNNILNSINGSTVNWMNPSLLGNSFPMNDSLKQPKTNKSPLQGLNFYVDEEKNPFNNINSNTNISGNSNLNQRINGINNTQNNHSLLNSLDNSNNSNKSLGNGLGKGISSNNSNFNFNQNLQHISKPMISNEFFNTAAFMPSNNFNSFNPLQSMLSNDIQQNKESLTKISSSSSSSRTHSTKRGTIIIQAQTNQSPAVVNKQSSDSNNAHENIMNQQDQMNPLRPSVSDSHNKSIKQMEQHYYEQMIAGKLFGSKDTQNVNSLLHQQFVSSDNANNLQNQSKTEDQIKLEEEQDDEENNSSNQKGKKATRISKKQNLAAEEKVPGKKQRKNEPISKPVGGDHNCCEETLGLNYQEQEKPLKNQVKFEEEKKDKYSVKKEQIEEEIDDQPSEMHSQDQRATKNNGKSKNGDGQDKKSSSRQSQHKNVYKNFGKELLRYVRSKQSDCEELDKEEFAFLLNQLTGGLNDKDTKQTLPIQKKEKLQLLWTLKTESNNAPASNNKKSKDAHNKTDEDKDYYFITERDDEITTVDNIELKTKKYFRKISWEFFNEWAFQYVMSSRKLDKKEIHLKCIPSFLYGIMCPKSLEVFKPIRENEKVTTSAINPTKPSNSAHSLNC